MLNGPHDAGALLRLDEQSIKNCPAGQFRAAPCGEFADIVGMQKAFTRFVISLHTFFTEQRYDAAACR
jgi:hypothetical protein